MVLGDGVEAVEWVFRGVLGRVRGVEVETLTRWVVRLLSVVVMAIGVRRPLICDDFGVNELQKYKRSENRN